MNEQFSLEEFLDPCILEWMDIDSLMDSEHAATVTHHSGDLGLASVPQAEARGVSPNVSQVRNLTEESTSSASHTVQLPKFKRANEDELQHLIELNENSHTKRSTATWLRRFNEWTLHRQMRIDDITDIPRAELDGVLQQFYES